MCDTLGRVNAFLKSGRSRSQGAGVRGKAQRRLWEFMEDALLMLDNPSSKPIYLVSAFGGSGGRNGLVQVRRCSDLPH